MLMEYQTGFCKQCDNTENLERPKVNHLTHLAMSIISVGLWAVIWLVVVIKGNSWHCKKCGSSKVKPQ